MAERILIVEDEEKIARFIELELKHEGYEVSKCANGREGLAVGTAEKSGLGFGDLVMDARRYEVRVAGQQVELTNREFELLKILLENKNIVMTREVLLNRVCGYDYMGETNMIDVYIRYLRSKIDERFGIRMIQTVRGVGYVIREERPEDE